MISLRQPTHSLGVLLSALGIAAHVAMGQAARATGAPPGQPAAPPGRADVTELLPSLETLWRKKVTPDRLIVDDPVLLAGTVPRNLPRVLCQVLDYVAEERQSRGEVRLTLRSARSWRHFVQAMEQVALARRLGSERAVLQGLDTIAQGLGPEGSAAPGGQGKPGPLEAFIHSLSMDQRQALASVAAEPPGLISGTTSSHEQGRILFRTPLGALPAGLRDSLTTRRRNADAASVAAAGDPAVAIHAGHGAYTLELRSGEERTMLQVGVADRAEFAAVTERFRQASAELRLVLEREQRPLPGWFDPQNTPLPAYTTARWKGAAFPMETLARGERDAARVLTEFSQRAGAPVVADGFARSTYLQVSEAPTQGHLGPAPAAVWARRIAARFRRYYRVEGDCLLLQSRERWWDRFVEPDRAVVAGLETAWEEGRNGTLVDYAWCGRLRLQQLRELPRFSLISRRPYQVLASQCLYQWPLIQFLGPQLDPKVPASSERGSFTSGAGTGQQRSFSRLLWSGEPVTQNDPLPKGRQVRWQVVGDTAQIDFLDEKGGRIGRHRLRGQRPPRSESEVPPSG